MVIAFIKINRIVVNIIKPKMVTDGLNTKGLWYSRKHIRLVSYFFLPTLFTGNVFLTSHLIFSLRLKYHELLFVPRARSLMSQNGLYVRLVL